MNRQRRPSQLDPVFLQNAVRYSLSIPGLTGSVIGVHDAVELRQNIRYVLNAAPLSEVEREALRKHGQELAAGRLSSGVRGGLADLELGQEVGRQVP